MRRGSFSGIAGVNIEDIAVQESMGAIYDRTQGAPRDERRRGDPHAPADARLGACASSRDGEPPLGLAEPVPYESCVPKRR